MLAPTLFLIKQFFDSLNALRMEGVIFMDAGRSYLSQETGKQLSTNSGNGIRMKPYGFLRLKKAEGITR